MGDVDRTTDAGEVLAALLAALEDSIIVLHHVVLQGGGAGDGGGAKEVTRERARDAIEHLAKRVATRFPAIGEAIDADSPAVDCAKFIVEHADALIGALDQLRPPVPGAGGATNPGQR